MVNVSAMEIRTAVPDDAEAVAAVQRETFPYLVMSAATCPAHDHRPGAGGAVPRTGGHGARRGDHLGIARIDELDPRQVYTADTVASLDEPGDSPLDAIEYDDWLREIWESPAQDKALGTAVVIGDEVACFTAVEVDGDRVWSGMTGTIPAYRGRGLAKLVKSVALRRAAAAGVTGAFTSNDDENGPMLAVNNWLGYRRVRTQTGLLRTL